MMIAGCDGGYEKRNSFSKLAKILAGYYDATACADKPAFDAALCHVLPPLRLTRKNKSWAVCQARR
jgi:hypothetical protein